MWGLRTALCLWFLPSLLRASREQDILEVRINMLVQTIENWTLQDPSSVSDGFLQPKHPLHQFDQWCQQEAVILLAFLPE